MHHDHHENISNLEICNAASVISADVVLGDRLPTPAHDGYTLTEPCANNSIKQYNTFPKII